MGKLECIALTLSFSLAIHRVIVSGWLERRRLQTEKEEMEIIGDLDGKFKAAFIYSHSYLGGFVSIIVCEPVEWNRCLHRY